MTYPVPLRRRSPAEQLRYLADQLDAGQALLVVGVALTMVAEDLVNTADPVEPPPSEAACGSTTTTWRGSGQPGDTTPDRV